MTCIYCHQELNGMYMRDGYGRSAHQSHAMPCFSCGQFVTAKDLKLPDGRPLCARCDKMAVKESAHIEWVRQKVLGMYRKYNVGIKNDIPIVLIDYRQMLKLHQRPSSASAHHYGLTFSRSTSSLFKTTWEHKVYMLDHLHRVAFGGILAHEFFHVWQNEQRLNFRPELCEGLCNLGSYLMYGEMEHEIARELTRQMEVSPDPVYGNGFRMVKAVYEHNRGDLKATITELRKMNQ